MSGILAPLLSKKNYTEVVATCTGLEVEMASSNKLCVLRSVRMLHVVTPGE